MKIKSDDLQRMNDMIENGAKVSEVRDEYPQYEYQDVYMSVYDYSLIGKKRKISNRLKKLRNSVTGLNQELLIDEIKSLLDSLYKTSNRTGKKLREIMKILDR